MKRDGRTLDHATLETIRLMSVERVLEGEVASAVITSYGFNRTTIYKRLTAAAKPGVGLRALQCCASHHNGAGWARNGPDN
jgi:hypothetical protein